MKNMDMLAWMNDLDAKYLEEAAAPQIHMQKKRRRLLPALIAAAAAVVGMTAGVSAYLNYNKQMVQFGFGTIGEARMAEISMPEPVTADNGTVSVTVENVLSDGIQVMLLLTLEPVDKTQPFDWSGFDDDYYQSIRNEFDIGAQEIHTYILSDTMDDCRAQQDAANQRWVVLYFPLPQDVTEEELATATYRTFLDVVENPEGEDYVSGELFAGISIPVNLTKNVDAVQMRSADGLELTLSAFEFYQYGRKIPHNDWFDMAVTWKNGTEQEITFGGIAGVDKARDGETVSWANLGIPVDPQAENLNYDIRSNPEDWYGFIEVSEVASLRMGDTVYYTVE